MPSYALESIEFSLIRQIEYLQTGNLTINNYNPALRVEHERILEKTTELLKHTQRLQK